MTCTLFKDNITVIERPIVALENVCKDCAEHSGSFMRCAPCRKKRNDARAPRPSMHYWPTRPKPSNPAAAIKLRELLADQRAEGLLFRDAWSRSVKTVCAQVNNADERRDWQAAFRSTADAWRSAYAREDTTGASVLALAACLTDKEHERTDYAASQVA